MLAQLAAATPAVAATGLDISTVVAIVTGGFGAFGTGVIVLIRMLLKSHREKISLRFRNLEGAVLKLNGATTEIARLDERVGTLLQTLGELQKEQRDVRTAIPTQLEQLSSRILDMIKLYIRENLLDEG